eukprot:10933684-Lingulodinium_polyedra.AAC.1
MRHEYSHGSRQRAADVDAEYKVGRAVVGGQHGCEDGVRRRVAAGRNQSDAAPSVRSRGGGGTSQGIGRAQG